MRAIETQYRGYRFRSRLEARWAVFLDTLGGDWRYETEGFEFEDGSRYLPDFWVPCPKFHSGDSGYWLEIKGQPPSAAEIAKCQNLAQYSGHITLLAYGDINAEHFGKYSFDPVRSQGRVVSVKVHHSEERDPAIERFFALLKHDPSKEPFYSHWSLAERFWSGQKDGVFDQAAFESALVAARAARFEHGESGA
jgi:hypothetical protein